MCELAAAEKLDRGYLGRILLLTLLAPDSEGAGALLMEQIHTLDRIRDWFLHLVARPAGNPFGG